MQGNKNPTYSLKENEAGNYHLRMTFQIHIPQEKRYESNERIVKVSVRDFAAYRKPETQKAVGWTELEVLHDPTFSKPIPTQPVKAVDTPTDAPESMPVKETQGIINKPARAKPKRNSKSKSK